MQQCLLCLLCLFLYVITNYLLTFLWCLSMQWQGAQQKQHTNFINQFWAFSEQLQQKSKTRKRKINIISKNTCCCCFGERFNCMPIKNNRSKCVVASSSSKQASSAACCSSILLRDQRARERVTKQYSPYILLQRNMLPSSSPE